MAIDPMTAQLLAKAAAVAADKDTREKLLYVILIAVSCAVTVLLISLYLLTHPMEALESVFAETPDEIAFVEGYKQENDDKVLVFGESLIQAAAYPLPVIGAVITSEYGERIDPFTSESAFHYGTDFAGLWQSEIYAIADGEVVKVSTKKNNDYGNYMIIRHKTAIETFYTMYAHMNDIYMFEGQSVKQGALIGLMGGDPERDKNPGRSTGTHLHFEIRNSQNGKGINPVGYIFAVPDITEETTDENE